MNLNDFVVLPNNKAKSVKLNSRNLQELKMETVSLAHKSKEMEEKLQQLKESMSKEKEERGQSGGFKWKSGQSRSLNSNPLTNSTKKNKDNRLQKLSAGKVKIRVLKDEPPTAPPQPPPPPSTIGLQTTRKIRLRGTHCGQCEVKTAGIMCAECSEDYCIGCFTRFHQKGALKLHRMIPIQTDLQTHVNAREVVSCFQNQIYPGPPPSTFANPSTNSKPTPNQTYSSNSNTTPGDQRPGKGPDVGAQYMQFPPEHSQVLAVCQREEKKVDMIEDREDGEGFPTSLLTGEYNEEESTRSFQEALRQWRGDEAAETMTEGPMWTPIRPVSMSAMATQADLAPVKGAEGGGRGEGSVPVRVEFTDNSLTYIDRLLLKKHRRTPIKTYCPSLASGTDSKPQPDKNTTEETACCLTAQEEDFHRYCASLFADPVSSGRPEPQITKPESCLVIEILDERAEDIHGLPFAQQRTDNRKVPSVQQPLSKGTLRTQTAIINSGSSLVSCPSPSPAPPSRQSTAPTPAKAAKKLHISKIHTSQPEHLTKSSCSKSKPSACLTAQTSKISIKTPTSKKSSFPPNVHQSKPDLGPIQHLSSPSPAHSQIEIPKPSRSPVLFPPDVSPVKSTRPPILEHRHSPSPSRSFSVRSTFTVSPSSSTESTLLPKVNHSTPTQKGSDVSLLSEQTQSSQLFSETISSPKLSQSFRSNQESSRQSQHSRCDPESLLSDNQLQLPLGSSSSTPQPKYLAQSPPVRYLLNKSPEDAFSRLGQTPTTEDSSVLVSPTPTSVDHESALDTPPLHFIDGIHNYLSNVKQEEEEEEDEEEEEEEEEEELSIGK
ncbi:uncharacterized protein zbbx [Eleginops maclovinus]|uniref:uncharacterized protein zbbx n=1 Tax=Eleginops maclovinus TaxID=56733 RepID=UPI003080A884